MTAKSNLPQGTLDLHRHQRRSAQAIFFPEPDRLVRVQDQTDWSTSVGNQWAFAYPNYLDCKRESRSVNMAVQRYGCGTVIAPGGAAYINSREISADLFPMLGVAIIPWAKLPPPRVATSCNDGKWGHPQR